MQQLEESGNMVIMTLAYAQRTNDTAYLTKHYETLKGWTAYLVEDSLIPSNQISTDDFAGSLANQTNLAIKGIIGKSSEVACKGKAMLIYISSRHRSNGHNCQFDR